MQGTKIDQMKDAMITIIDELGPEDRLKILTFSDDVWNWLLEKEPTLILLKPPPLQNGGFARRIHAGADAALQLENFFTELSSPLLYRSEEWQIMQADLPLPGHCINPIHSKLLNRRLQQNFIERRVGIQDN
ncbi:unnamed protein product [Lepeophtheirus salmonis]|uniref:(salmon louse) hypothetical protein n=1 Tax=Lepeophtheirus salmonis TaxID=72036 RepID=A0A7R8CYX7_LEPSM|nr:unnamed protein product [Lepeophtheirus salmonis]CAF2972021.1 unnamed protein product [Lepeophtheirus salmonis]